MSEVEPIKCVVWDLDGTLWNGVLIEGDPVRLRPGIQEVIRTLDQRGILHSIASKNDAAAAMDQLRQFGLHEYFLYPEINWNAKSRSIARIQRHLNVAKDSLLFIDDEACERDEVFLEHPEVTCMDARDSGTLLSHPRLTPRFVTEDAGRRRLRYLAQMNRTRSEEGFVGPRTQFLASLRMRLRIDRATEDDLQRAEELTVRTHQLNTTGRTYDYAELKTFVHSPDHELLVCDLEDKYGDHGKIGLALVAHGLQAVRLKLFLMSCRVISLGVGTVLLSYILRRAKASGRVLQAEFRHTGRNRPMYITFRMANFKERTAPYAAGSVLLENDLSIIPPWPAYLELSLPENHRPLAYG